MEILVGQKVIEFARIWRMKYVLLALLIEAGSLQAADYFIETESFENLGGWVVDTQYIDRMGSSYLMAHGLGIPVQPASTLISLPKTGEYQVFVRTYNWTSPWTDKPGPGQFQLSLDGKIFSPVLGATRNCWTWENAGSVKVSQTDCTLALHDLTGFNGRCDAIYFTTEGVPPPADIVELSHFRHEKLKLPQIPISKGHYDLVVIGGGVAGISASVAAARLGLRVALVQNRPILGGNNSSDVRVHLGGRIEAKPYTKLGGLQKEFGPTRGGNAQPKEYYEDQKKEDFVRAEPNISLFLNYHAFAVQKEGNRITSVTARHTRSGEEISIQGTLFADCTGDANLGYLAGASFMKGREARSEFNEPMAPETRDDLTLGASIQWYSKENARPTSFPLFRYGLQFNKENSEKVSMGEWTWETGLNRNQIDEAENIRDYGIMVVFSNWSYLKNEYESDTYKNRSLDWVAFIAGKRESRRLIGDYILTQNDVTEGIQHPDASGSTTWSIDLHYPDPRNAKFFPERSFKAIAKQTNIHPYPIPYRCLYSKDIDNLFMAGRDISVTHTALGTTRVMRTCGIFGEVVGMAASLCKKHQTLPRGIYQNHLDDLKKLMTLGVAADLPNNQTYNLGGTLGDRK